MNLSLPVSDAVFRSLLRGTYSGTLPTVRPNEAGRVADVMSLGSPSLFAISPRLADGLREFDGIRLRNLKVANNAAIGFQLLTVTASCGHVDYRASTVVRRFGTFVRLRGILVEHPDVVGHFAVPADRDSIFLSDFAENTLRSGRYTNLRLRRMADIEFDVEAGAVDAPGHV